MVLEIFSRVMGGGKNILIRRVGLKTIYSSPPACIINK